MNYIHKIAFILLIIGGLNWGLEVLNFGIGNYIPAILASIIYILVAASALYEIFTHKENCKNCEVKSSGQM